MGPRICKPTCLFVTKDIVNIKIIEDLVYFAFDDGRENKVLLRVTDLFK